LRFDAKEKIKKNREVGNICYKSKVIEYEAQNPD